MRCLFLETTMVLLEESPIQRGPFFHNTFFWSPVWHHLLEERNMEQDLSNIQGAIYVSTFFLAASNCITVQPDVAIERTVFYRERAAGMYSSVSYAFSQVCIEILYVSLQSLLYAVLLFTMIGFGTGAGKFFWFFYFTFMCFIIFTLFGVMIVSITPNHQIAGILSGFFFSLWNIFTGFIIPRLQIPIYLGMFYMLEKGIGGMESSQAIEECLWTAMTELNREMGEENFWDTLSWAVEMRASSLFAKKIYRSMRSRTRLSIPPASIGAATVIVKEFGHLVTAEIVNFFLVEREQALTVCCWSN